MTDIEAVKSAVKEAMKEEMQAFYIAREEHYQHHQFIKGLKAGVDACQSTIARVGLASVVVGIIAVTVLGFVAWIKERTGM